MRVPALMVHWLLSFHARRFITYESFRDFSRLLLLGWSQTRAFASGDQFI